MHVLQGCSVEHRPGLAELTQFWGEKTLIEGEKTKKEFFEGGEFGSVLSPVKSFEHSFEERDLI